MVFMHAALRFVKEKYQGSAELQASNIVNIMRATAPSLVYAKHTGFGSSWRKWRK